MRSFVFMQRNPILPTSQAYATHQNGLSFCEWSWKTKFNGIFRHQYVLTVGWVIELDVVYYLMNLYASDSFECEYLTLQNNDRWWSSINDAITMFTHDKSIFTILESNVKRFCTDLLKKKIHFKPLKSIEIYFFFSIYLAQYSFKRNHNKSGWWTYSSIRRFESSTCFHFFFDLNIDSFGLILK